MANIKTLRTIKLEEQKLVKMIAEHNVKGLKDYLDTRNDEFPLSSELMKSAFREFLAKDETHIINSHTIISLLHDYIMDDKRKAQYMTSPDQKIAVELCELHERALSHKAPKAGSIVTLNTAEGYGEKMKVVEARQAKIGEVKAKLDKHFIDRKVASTEEFEEAGKKEAGVSKGYVGRRKGDEQVFLLKAAEKTTDFAAPDQVKNDRRDFIHEYVTAPLYRRLLFDRAPIFELTVMNEMDTKMYGTPKFKAELSTTVYGRSKFFDEFKVLGEFAGAGNADINPKHPNLEKLEGFEKVIAACLFAGETDYHAGNLGVVSKMDDDGKIHNTVVKIDHGRSAIGFFTNKTALIEDMISRFREAEYTTIPFDVIKFKTAIDEMVNISDDEIEKMVGSRFDTLIRAGFKFEGVNASIALDEKEQVKVMKDDSADSIEELKQQYVSNFKQQRDLLIQLSADLDMIAAINFKTQQGKINPLLEINGTDPVVYAMKNSLAIGDMEPLQYAIKNNKISPAVLMHAIVTNTLIGTEDPFEYAVKHNKINGDVVLWAIKNNKLIEGKDPLYYAVINEIALSGMPPLAYAVKRDLTIKGMDPIDYAFVTQAKLDKAIVEQAARKSKPIEGKDPYIYAIENNITIEGMDPIKHALSSKKRKIGNTDAMEYVLNNNLMDIHTLLFAIEKDIDINGKAPVLYAIENPFEGFDPIKYAISKLIYIEGKDPIIYAIQKEIKLDGKNPIHYAATQGKVSGAAALWAIENKEKIETQDALLYAVHHNIHINDNPIEYAIKNGARLEGEHPIDYALKNLPTNSIVYPLIYAIENGILVNGMTISQYCATRESNPIKSIPNHQMARIDPTIPSLTFFLEEYTRASQAKELPEYLKKLETEFTRIQTALNKDKARTILDASSSLGQFLNSAPSFVIAEKLGANPKELSKTKVDEDLMTGCSLDVLVRITKVTKHIDTGLKETPITYLLHMFVDLMKNIAGKGANDAKVLEAAKDIDGILPGKEVVGSFTGKLVKASQELQSKGQERE